MKLGLFVSVIVLAVAGLFLRPVPHWSFELGTPATLGTGAEFETIFEHNSQLGVAHAPAFAVRDGALELVWFDGIRESHNDVEIFHATVPLNTYSATPGAPILSRQKMSNAMMPRQTILTLGNTIFDAADTGYFVTVVTLGGWAAAGIAHWDPDGGVGRKLNLSSVIARSHLVRSPMVGMQDGFRLVPAYFEVSEGYGVTALVDAQNRVRGQGTMRGEFAGIQPMIVPLSDKRAVALLRKFDKRQTQMLVSWTEDGGASWSSPQQTNIANPNAPVAAVRLEDGRVLMAYSVAEDDARTLRFATSDDDGASWIQGRKIDTSDTGSLRYPMMAVLPDGRIALTYSSGTKTSVLLHVLSADWAVAQ